MGINPDFRDLFYELNAADVGYLLVGAYAVTFHLFRSRRTFVGIRYTFVSNSGFPPSI